MVKINQEQYNDMTISISRILQETPCIRYGQAFAIVINEDYPELCTHYWDMYTKDQSLDMWEVKDPNVVHEFIVKNFLA